MICPSRQLSALTTGENVSYSPSYPTPLSESVVTVPLQTDFGQRWRMPSALCLPYPELSPTCGVSGQGEETAAITLSSSGYI